VPAIDQSPIGDSLFHTVFGNTVLAVMASMISYLFAQFIDIQLYHFWKKLTSGKMLWLRNNFSTFFSQFIDTFTVLFLLCSFELISWENFGNLLISGFLFKILIAICDTPFLYAGVYGLRKFFNLEPNEEIKLHSYEKSA
jgi:uncharacterized integral membrane protein (TIGR00697 family)